MKHITLKGFDEVAFTTIPLREKMMQTINIFYKKTVLYLAPSRGITA